MILSRDTFWCLVTNTTNVESLRRLVIRQRHWSSQLAIASWKSEVLAHRTFYDYSCVVRLCARFWRTTLGSCFLLWFMQVYHYLERKREVTLCSVLTGSEVLPVSIQSNLTWLASLTTWITITLVTRQHEVLRSYQPEGQTPHHYLRCVAHQNYLERFWRNSFTGGVEGGPHAEKNWAKTDCLFEKMNSRCRNSSNIHSETIALWL